MYTVLNNSKSGQIYVTLFIILLLSATFFIEKVKADEIVPLVIVNGDTISTSDLDQQVMQLHRVLTPEKRKDYDYQKLIKKQINDRLIIQEARAIGMDSEDFIVEKVREVQVSEARKLFVRNTFSYDSEISEKEITDNFTKNYFKVELRTLSVRDCEEAAKYAKMIYNGMDMDSLAKEISLDSRRYVGGVQSLKHWILIGDDIKKLVENLEVGELTEPFPFREACMIIRLDKRVAADSNELPELTERIRKIIDKKRRTDAWANLTDSLDREYSVKIDSTVLKSIQNDSAIVFRGEFTKNGTDQQLISAVGYDGLTDVELRKKLSHRAMNASDRSFRDILQNTIDEVTELLVLGAAAEEKGFTNDPKVLEKMQKTTDSTMIDVYLQENVVSRITFSREEFQEYYDANPDKFRKTGEIRLYAMQLADEETANTALQRLNEGADFNYVSKELEMTDGIAHNEDEWLKANKYPEQITTQLDSLADGQYTSPLAIATGWVIFKVRDRRPGELKTLDDVDTQIKEIMFQKKFTVILDEVLATLRESSEIQYFHENINSYFGDNSGS